MTQEESKKFLNSKTPHDKFKFFKLGTSLDQIEQNYLQTEKILCKASNDICQTEIAVRDLELEEKKLSSKLTKIEKINEIGWKIERATSTLVWCSVRKYEKQLAAIEKEITDTKVQIQKHLEGKNNVTEKLKKAEKQLRDEKMLISQFRSEQNVLKEKMVPLYQKKNNAENSIRNTQVGLLTSFLNIPSVIILIYYLNFKKPV